MSEAHSQRAHARLAPSAAHRWLECPGSVRMEAGFPRDSNVFADEGTAAHQVCSLCLETGDDAAEWLGGVSVIEAAEGAQTVFKADDPGRPEPDGAKVFAINDEMVDAVQVYLDHCRGLVASEPAAIVEVEQRLDMTNLHPDIFGTGDHSAYLPSEASLHVSDFKYGKGVVVSPVDNPQLMLYGAGAARKHGRLPINGITLHIVQPRAMGEPVKSWVTDALTLLEFEDEIRVRAAATEVPAPPLVAGDHCRFCKAAAVCPALAEHSLKSALAEFGDATDIDGFMAPTITVPDAPSLTPPQLAYVLSAAEMIGNWVKAVQAYAHAEAIAGRIPDGFKLVPKRATRKWGDEVEARQLLELFDVDPYAEPEVKSPAQLEKTLGKKKFEALCAEIEATGVKRFVVKESSGLNLVPNDDPRGAAKVAGLLDFAENVET